MFNITIESVIGPEARVHFQVCHPDQWRVPSGKNIALDVIVETFHTMKMGYGFTGRSQPISKQSASTLIASHPQLAQLERWLEIMERWDGIEFSAEAAIAIESVRLENEIGNPKQVESDPDPSATLVLKVIDPSVLFHMVDGFRFDSAMCDCELW